jgi:hypothetical protein
MTAATSYGLLGEAPTLFLHKDFSLLFPKIPPFYNFSLAVDNLKNFLLNVEI